ncbi:MAG: PAS domain-containing protein, partial [Luteolibacter sp.]
MAKRVKDPASKAGKAASAARAFLGGVLGPPPEIAVPDLPAEMFSPLGMLGLADELPVMIGYFDRDMRYRFLNKALADWLEMPRSEILGRTPQEITGDEAFREREPVIRAALAG